MVDVERGQKCLLEKIYVMNMGTTMDSNFILGTGDPPVYPDIGAGPWRSQPVTANAKEMHEFLFRHMHHWSTLLGADAADHLRHYLGNTGANHPVDLESLLRDAPSAAALFTTSLADARAFASSLKPGIHQITSRARLSGSVSPTESANWFFAVGEYNAWGKAVVTVTVSGTRRRALLNYEYKFFDRYNWDKGKAVSMLGMTITDEQMGRLHLQGLAREYNLFGSVKRLVEL